MTETERELIIDITSIKKDVSVMQKCWDKFEITLDKVIEAVSTITSTLKLHDNKLSYQEDKDRGLAEDARILLGRFDSLNTNVLVMQGQIERLIDEMGDFKKEFAKDNKEDEAQEKVTEGTFSKFYKWIWLGLGGLVVISWELSNIPIVKIITTWFDGTGTPPIPFHK